MLPVPNLRWIRLLACWLSLAVTGYAEQPSGFKIIDSHVHLWDISRPAGLRWIKKDDKVLNRNFLPPDHEPVAHSNSVGA